MNDTATRLAGKVARLIPSLLKHQTAAASAPDAPEAGLTGCYPVAYCYEAGFASIYWTHAQFFNGAFVFCCGTAEIV
jgi:hypothetical protein